MLYKLTSFKFDTFDDLKKSLISSNSILCYLGPGFKRKQALSTQVSTASVDSVLPPSTPTAPASQPIQTRRESNRKIKKPKYDFFDDSTVATSGDVVSTTTRSDLHTPLSIQTSGGGDGADSSLSNTPAAAGSSRPSRPGIRAATCRGCRRGRACPRPAAGAARRR